MNIFILTFYLPEIFPRSGQNVVIVGGESHGGDSSVMQLIDRHHRVVVGHLAISGGRGQGQLRVEVGHDHTAGLSAEDHVTGVVITDLSIYYSDLATTERLQRPREVGCCEDVGLKTNLNII